MTKPCSWPTCLTEEQQQHLADILAAADRGEETVPMPDQRPICGCFDGPIEWNQL